MTNAISVKDNFDYCHSSTESENSYLDSSSSSSDTLNPQVDNEEKADNFDDGAQKETEQRIRFLRKKFTKRRIHLHQIIRDARSTKTKSKVFVTDDLLSSWLQHMSIRQHGAEQSSPKNDTKANPPQNIAQEDNNNKHVFRSTPMKFINVMELRSTAQAPSIQRTDAFDVDNEFSCLQ